MTLILEEFHDVDHIPADFDPLFEMAGKRTVFLSKDWFSLLARSATPTDSNPRLLVVRDQDSTPLAVLPCLETGRTLTGFSNYYSHEFSPLLQAATNDKTRLRALKEIAASLAGSPVISIILKPFTPDDPTLALSDQAFREAGFKTARFNAGIRHFITTDGLSGGDYRNRLPSRLTNTIQRRQKADQHLHRFQLFATSQEVQQAIDLYQQVYASSWKPPEPWPDFIPGFAALLATRGSLRLGIWFVEEKAAAAQLWIVENNRASIFKLAHDPAYENQSVGTALTLKMFQSILDSDQPKRIDFGIGSEAFKTDWTPDSEALIGLVAFNSRTLLGRLQHLRHAAGRLIKRSGRASTGARDSNNGEPKVQPR